MGMLDKSATKEEFDLFKKNILEKIDLLDQKIEHRVQDTEENINNIEIKANESITNIKDKEVIIEGYLSKISASKDEIEKILQITAKQNNDSKVQNEQLKSEVNESITLKDELFTEKERIFSLSKDIQDKIDILEETLEIGKSLPSEIDNIKEITETVVNLHNEIEALQTHSIDKKSKIDKLYNEIYGQDIENENGEIEHTNGLIDELKKSYSDIETDLKNFDTILNKEIEETRDNFDTLLKESRKSAESVQKKLQELLPGAMASGLSSAYIDKTNNEKESKKQLENNFKWSITGLVLISLIPVSVDIYRLIFTETNLVQVIKDTPNLIISMGV